MSLLKIPVTDIARSASFYRDALGFAEGFVAAEYGWAQFSAGDLSLTLYVPGMGGGEAAVGGSAGFHLALPVSAFDALAESLLQLGVLEEGRVHEGNDGTVFLDVRDPDGNVVKIVRLDEE